MLTSGCRPGLFSEAVPSSVYIIAVVIALCLFLLFKNRNPPENFILKLKVHESLSFVFEIAKLA